MSSKTHRTGAKLLVDQLRLQGVERLSCVPGESYLAVLDELRDSGIDTLVCRNEGGAALMAEAFGKLTGRPGICFVTRGPGATNACHGLHVAMQDSTPLILFVGQVESAFRDREAFQELDYRAAFGGIAKWVCEIDDPNRVPELVARAFRVALQGRPGPVVVALPEQMLTTSARVGDAPAVRAAEPAPDDGAMDAMWALLDAARSPLLIVGGSRWNTRAVERLTHFAQRWSLPVVTSFRRAGLFPADHAQYAGELGFGPNPKLVARIRSADMVLLVGGRLSEVPSNGYTLLDVPAPAQALVHVHPDAGELGKVYQPRVAIHASPSTWCERVAQRDPPADPRWRASAAGARADYLEWTSVAPTIPGDFQYGRVIQWLRQRLARNAIVCNGAGNYAIWLHRFFRFHAFNAQLAPTSGSMGYGVPAAIMAKRQFPDRTVVALAGDGCFLMNGQEFATAVHHGIAMIVIVIDNGMYGTIRMHQERNYPGRVHATDLTNPDFAALARAYGGHGERVSDDVDFEAAFERAVASGKPALIHCLLNPEAITPAATLSSLQAT